MRTFLASLLILIGVGLLSFGGYLTYLRYSPRKLSFNNSQNLDVEASTKKGSTPVRLIIAKENIDLAIVPSEITNGTWQVTTTGVSYWDKSALPGEVGNSVFYGHNWTSLLGKLVYVKPGDTIRIVYEDGTAKDFRVDVTQVVTPDQVGIIAPSKDRRITIYTCTGFLDSKRFVAVALLQG
jgi:LPXTG-site transpeptidase (sortase) family protein